MKRERKSIAMDTLEKQRAAIAKKSILTEAVWNPLTRARRSIDTHVEVKKVRKRTGGDQDAIRKLVMQEFDE